MVIVWFGVLFLSFYFLAKIVDDFFVFSLEKISKKLKMSSNVAGATLMAVGSSAPELFVSLLALIKPGSHEAVGMGTIVGSALFNVLVIVGVSAIVKTAILSWKPVVRDTLFYVASIILLLTFFWNGKISLIEAAILVILYFVYILAVIYWDKILPSKKTRQPKKKSKIRQSKGKKSSQENSKPSKTGLKKISSAILKKIFPSKKHFYLIFIISIIYIAGLSWVLVESAIEVARFLNIPSAIIALTVLAVGTSIPDLMSSVIVARKGRGGMAISNAIGSNVFDILIGLGFPWALMILIQPQRHISVSTENLLSSIILLFATVLVIFFLLMIQRWKIGKYGGWFLVILYIGYLIWAIGRVM
ncbi:MAG: calcium/sodium antiporter [Candidatus Moranbacteria bacterium]|nr:calcium/sodium antiporter [Candidatus Moranbacteria bacterium]